MKLKNNAKVLEKERNKFKIDKYYLIELNNKKISSYKISQKTLVKCIKKYKNYALFDVIGKNGDRLYTTALDYISDFYISKEVRCGRKN